MLKNKLTFLLFILLIPLVYFICQGQQKSVASFHCDQVKNQLRQCPFKEGKVILPRTYPASSIFVGFDANKGHTDFIDFLVETTGQHPHSPKLNILIPRLQINEAYDFLAKYFDRIKFPQVNLLTTSSDETIWAQDYFEIVWDANKRENKFLDLPYLDREGELIPHGLALTCQKELIAQPDYSQAIVQPGNGDYGGNIEAFSEKILFVGNNLTDETLQKLTEELAQTIIKLRVDWLETGHVDELFSLLPMKENASACEQTLVYSSPKLALKLLEKTHFSELTPLPIYLDEESAPRPDYFTCLDHKNNALPMCKNFFNANIEYEQIQQQNLTTIQSSFQKIHGCELKTLAFPQLFSPAKDLESHGQPEDQAVAFNQNSVNNIFFWPQLIVPRQSIPPFQDWISDELAKFPIQIKYADGNFVHELKGGIHCASNIAYSCNPLD